MTSPAIEVIVLSASTNETKKSGKTRKVTFLLPNDGPHPFEGMGGERFHIVCVRVNDDETPAEDAIKPFPRIDRSGPLEPWVGCGECGLNLSCYRGKTTCIREPKLIEGPKARQPFHQLPYPQQAALRIKREAFRRFLSETTNAGVPLNEEAANTMVKNICDVESKAQIKRGSWAGGLWEILDGDFRDWMREPVI
jgi:hypothetical protein